MTTETLTPDHDTRRELRTRPLEQPELDFLGSSAVIKCVDGELPDQIPPTVRVIQFK